MDRYSPLYIPNANSLLELQSVTNLQTIDTHLDYRSLCKYVLVALRGIVYNALFLYISTVYASALHPIPIHSKSHRQNYNRPAMAFSSSYIRVSMTDNSLFSDHELGLHTCYEPIVQVVLSVTVLFDSLPIQKHLNRE